LSCLQISQKEKSVEKRVESEQAMRMPGGKDRPVPGPSGPLSLLRMAAFERKEESLAVTSLREAALRLKYRHLESNW
jgi:hypothetical protein